MSANLYGTTEEQIKEARKNARALENTLLRLKLDAAWGSLEALVFENLGEQAKVIAETLRSLQQNQSRS